MLHYSQKIFIAIVLLLSCCSFGTAQDGTGATTPTLCNLTQSMNFDPNQLAGTWYEVARNPAPPTSFECVQVDFTVMPNNVMNIATTYSNTPAFPWVNQTMFANITVDNSSTNGYNLSYVNPPTNTPYTVFKLLDTDYTNYALICGYQNTTSNSTFFGVVLTRERTPNATVLNSYEETASMQYAQFLNGSMASILQTEVCYAPSGANGLTKSMGLHYMLFAVFYLMTLFIY